MITMGGNAEIECIDNSNPFSEGQLIVQHLFWRIIAEVNYRCGTVYYAP